MSVARVYSGIVFSDESFGKFHSAKAVELGHDVIVLKAGLAHLDFLLSGTFRDVSPKLSHLSIVGIVSVTSGVIDQLKSISGSTDPEKPEDILLSSGESQVTSSTIAHTSGLLSDTTPQDNTVPTSPATVLVLSPIITLGSDLSYSLINCFKVVYISAS